MERIFLASPHMSEEGYELEYIHDAFSKNWIAPLGENVNEFEKAVRDCVRAENAVALSAGTAALHLAMILAGVSRGDKVFCQSLTFSASANPIAYLGAEPVYIDSERETWNMSPEALRRAFEECGLDIAFYAHRERALDELLPWDHIDAGIDKAFLKREYERAMRAQTTRDCREGCNGCGLQKLKGVCRACE